MFHRAVELRYLEGTKLSVSFQDGLIKEYDVAELFEKYPKMRALRDRELFLSGRLAGSYGIIWNDELDLETETVYECGRTAGTFDSLHLASAKAVLEARARSGISQKELAARSGIDQSDISRIERGIANPSVATLERIAAALGCELAITIK